MTKYRIVEHCNLFSIEVEIKKLVSTGFFSKVPVQFWKICDMDGNPYHFNPLAVGLNFPANKLASFKTLVSAKTEIARWKQREALEAEIPIIHEV